MHELLADKFIEEIGHVKPYPPLNNYSLFIFGSDYNTSKYFGGIYESDPAYGLLDVRYKGNIQIFLSGKAVHQFAVDTFTNYLKNPESLKRIEESFVQNFPRVDALYDKYSYAYIDVADEASVLPVLQQAVDIIWKSNAIAHFSILFDVDICFSILTNFYPDILKEDLLLVWEKMTRLTDESFDREQKRDLLQHAGSMDIDQLAEHCQYFYASYKTVYPLVQVKEELLLTYGAFLNNPEAVQAELHRMDAELQHEKEEFAAWKNSLTDVEKLVADYCQAVMRIRDRRKNHFGKGIAVMWRIAEKVFRTLDFDRVLIENILLEELAKGSEFVKTLKAELIKRNEEYVLYIPYRGPKEFSYERVEENYQRINNFFVNEDDKKQKEIRGQVGSKGKATGRAKVICSLDEFGLFEDGDVLVTGMTRPEYVPLMRKASAIVTDEGGITCHAAIVSRELGIPAVIGTKFATRIIQNGDIIEVDATNGIIKKL